MKTKNLLSFLLILGIVAISSQITSAQFTTRNRTLSQNNSQCDRTILSPIKCGFYEEGFQDGAADAKSNRSNEYKRYRSKFDSQYDSFYRDGYENGYSSVRPNSSRWTNDQREAYDRGYEYGEDDKDRRISRLPRRYEGRYDRTYEAYYTKGYLDGYDNRPRQYNVAIGRNGNRGNLPFPNRTGNRRGNRRGTATGTLTWNGRVDNRVNIVLRGDDVKTQAVAGRISGVYNNLRGVLPRRNSTVSVRKLDGRGTVRILQQPNRANNYTAIIEVYDGKRSDDNYNLQITWQASSVAEAYSPGKLTWRGRVDGTVDIKISGDFVEAIDNTGSGLNIIESRLEGYLAGRNGSIRVNKKDGRGTVSIIEQPSRFNDYTAIVRIFDPQGSDDEYELEVTW